MNPDPVFNAVLLAVAVSGCGPSAADTFPIGGVWHLHLRPTAIIEAGRRPADLYRDWRAGKVLVASDIEFHEYYDEPGCLLWETSGDAHVVYAACGDREPIIVATDDYHRWTMDRRGLVDERDARVNEQGAPVTPTAMFALQDIVDASFRQGPFNANWHAATARIDEQLSEMDVEVRIGVDASDDMRRTPLMHAAKSPNMPPGAPLTLVNSLLAEGANINTKDKWGFTPLMLAAERGNVDVVRRLMEAGADIHARNNDGRTALMEAAGSLQNQVEMVTMLLDAGADKNVRDTYGRTAFSAIRTNTDPQLKVLLALDK